MISAKFKERREKRGRKKKCHLQQNASPPTIHVVLIEKRYR